MKKLLFLLCFGLCGLSYAAPHECERLRQTHLRLLQDSTFDVNHPGPLSGCFSGYLPDSEDLEQGQYRFAIFRDGRSVIELPVVKGGGDLSSNPKQHLIIKAIAFLDMDRDGQRDVTIIGQRLAAKGEQIFVQIYWACSGGFVFDEKVNSELIALLAERQALTIKDVQRFINAKHIKVNCGRR